MIIHSPIVSGSLTFANGATFTLPTGGVYSGSFSGSYQGASFTGGTFSGVINSTNGVVSGSSQLTSSYDSRYLTIGGDGVISGSSQVVYTSLSSIPAGIVSGSSQLTSSFDTRYLNTGGDGVVSGSAQIDVSATTGDVALGTKTSGNYVATITAGNGIVTTGATTGEGITHTISVGGGVVSGSAQITPLLPTGTISGSSQVQLGSASGNIALATQTTGDYVASLVAGTNITLSNNSGENATPTIGLTNNSITIAGTSTSLGGSITAATILQGTGVVSGSSQITLASTTGFGTYIDQALLTTSDVTHNNVTISGNLTVNGTTTTVNSNIVNIGDNLIVLNSDETGTPSQNAGIEIERGTSTNATLVWDETTDLWEAGLSGSEVPLVTTTGTQTLTNKTIAAGSNTISGLTNSNLSGTAGITNANLANSTISGIALGSNLGTLTIGTGLSGTSYNGSTGVTIANTGVTSNVAGTGVSVSAGTGAVTISIGQSVATSANAQFNSLGIGMAASTTAGRIDATNDIVAYSSSDIRFKENIKPIENPLEKISKISGNTYDWKEENKIEHGYEGNDVGVIAQEIEEVLPQLVQTRESGYKAVKYDKLVALLIEGIKEQQSQIEELRNKIEKLENGK